MEMKADRSNREWNVMVQQSLPPEDEPTVYETPKIAVEKDSEHLSAESKRKEVRSEMLDHISASREVLGLVPAYSFWYLAQNPHVQQSIRDELKEANIDMISSPTPFDPQVISEMGQG
ncbi:hypothetical protein F5B22DRAFT_647968 [Xylaria bambusicola]|uniref:uncharacterized protein n=1 Tax=Xylaria bambusicola TaxID=326684 RepID=UPI00200774C7|nr:uncharacterized protein F5B22DRAFT_647968 [Xylaria bambusicola]KAI0513156.1 hypothetical protein F5B22DRAFT_647968 [Xylaria bambusicola]